HLARASFGALVFAIAACSRTGKDVPTVQPDRNGITADGAIADATVLCTATVGGADAARETTADVDANRVPAPSSFPGFPKPLNGKCPARALGPNPGPTPASPKKPLDDPSEYAPPAKDECTKHADCKDRTYGRCVRIPTRSFSDHGRRRVIPTQNACLYDECMSDAECRRNATHEPKKENACFCDAENANLCSFANCKLDTDCAPGFSCGSASYCHAPADECQKESDCAAQKKLCTYDWEGRRYLCKPPPVRLPG
ncbi:MAG: hypothetical protein KBF88_14640, partial [Polyangiaceae bacterium]|nr:hypothetical protein [Polyangiaceae bacterium]